jgi:hypothetical protein
MVMILTGCTKDVENQDATITLQDEDISVVYTGTTEDSVPNGEGSFTVTTSDGATWSGKGTFTEGTFDSGSVKDYFCSVTIGDTEFSGKYSGDVAKGALTGNGEFTCTDDENGNLTYNGEWGNGSLSGQGKVENLPITLNITKTDYDGIYSGDTKDGLPDGEGTFTYNKDDVNIKYDGQWSEGKMSGDGTLTDNDFTAYFSEDDPTDKKGEFSGTTKDGSAVSGSFTRTNDDGYTYTYTGEWSDNSWNGYGEQVFADDNYTNGGHWEKGVFKPSLSEYMTSLGSGNSGDLNYTVSDENKNFIDENNALFPLTADSGVDVNSYVDGDLSYEKYIKSPGDFSGKLMRSTTQEVVQIEEVDAPSTVGGTLTCMITDDVSTYDDVYYVFYPGSLENIYEGSTLTLVGLPLNTSSYENVGGGTTKCIIMLLAGIE